MKALHKIGSRSFWPPDGILMAPGLRTYKYWAKNILFGKKKISLLLFQNLTSVENSFNQPERLSQCLPMRDTLLSTEVSAKPK